MSELDVLRDRVAVVTGAGSGFGAALAHACAAAGMRVVLGDIQQDHAEKVAGELRVEGADARAARVDVGDSGSIEALASRVAGWHGSCDVLFANVGVLQLGSFERLSAEDWSWTFQVNVLGTAATVRAFLPLLRKGSDPRRVALTVSTNALFTAPRLAAYASSKYAVLGMAETLRLELADAGIGVCAVLPGPMLTTHMQSSAAAKPAGLGTPVFTDEDIQVVGGATMDDPSDMISPDQAARGVLGGLVANEPYVFTHAVHRARFERRVSEILAAYERVPESG
jgi:NAD(P)-dependent dehydrogenase (short-subunit alcohol dehydrogenase family)